MSLFVYATLQCYIFELTYLIQSANQFELVICCTLQEQHSVLTGSGLV